MKIKMNMKILNLLLLSAIMMVALSCKKDEDAPAPQNQFTINGKTSTFPKAFISSKTSASAGSPDSPASYGYTIWITEKGVSYDSDKGNLTGAGKYLDLILQSTIPNDNGLPAGTYSVSNNDISTAGLYELTATSEDFIGDEPSKGTIKVTKSGNSYTIDIDLTMLGSGVDNNFSLTGHYSGELTVVEGHF